MRKIYVTLYNKYPTNKIMLIAFTEHTMFFSLFVLHFFSTYIKMSSSYMKSISSRLELKNCINLLLSLMFLFDFLYVYSNLFYASTLDCIFIVANDAKKHEIFIASYYPTIRLLNSECV